ncbi:3-dehydroquinate synthase [Rhodopirellula sp. JC740]|uniref:3-dehydroquinate synthase n=1 Tax=Rhodopirellula halodulae TaxID=2894198 RepID=A0ABS8ND10_9BACT|nr:3-dehydroquinate synthase [Rhodopirellula sp. JC740]MCC9640723.1 3-dehydroquinate synthase [Rhodopirellula sp. JC740]
MASPSIEVALGERSYPIWITTSQADGSNPVDFASSFQDSVGSCSHAVLIHDAAIADTVANQVERVLAGMNIRVTNIQVPSGETSKSVAQLETIWNTMLGSGTDRQSVVVAVGGGVVGDLAGFAAASFTRGLRFVQVPTTLLSMVDSSVGGKTGINLPGGKNMVGSFWQPQMVWIDTQTLSTLPDRDFISGMAEVIKYGVIEDAEFFSWLKDNTGSLAERNPDALRHAITRSCESKARVVAEDERETSGRRAILNYGHTFAHAIEATAGYGVCLHGEAVAIGMQMAARLGIDMELCPPSLLEEQTAVLEAAKLPLVWKEADPDQMLPVMARDKKVAHGKLRFILPNRIGDVSLVGDVPAEKVIRAIEACRSMN